MTIDIRQVFDMTVDMKEKVLSAFKDAFDEGAEPACYFAPGRINLIGEHTDYNGGHVFPCALTFGTYAAVRRRGDDLLRLSSVNFPEDGVSESSIKTLTPLSDNSWTAYVKGVIWAVLDRYDKDDKSIVGSPGAGAVRPGISGMDIVIGGDVPAGAGLSSSASLETAIGYMLSDQFGLGLTNQEIALIGQRAENEYVGVSCGIMDQFASAMGKKDHAIFLDTNTLEYEYVPLTLRGCTIMITNTNKPHTLNDSAYNDRRRECAEALNQINEYICTHPEQETLGAKAPKMSCSEMEQTHPSGTGDFGCYDALCRISAEDFSVLKAGISDPVLLRRARHAVTEDQRTRDAVNVLRAGDIAAFGKLMDASHVSLRDDYEVSCPELDLLAETAWGIPGVLGSRMTGGGFGGCTVSIIKDSSVGEYEEAAAARYREAFGYDCTFIRAAAGDGPHRV